MVGGKIMTHADVLFLQYIRRYIAERPEIVAEAFKALQAGIDDKVHDITAFAGDMEALAYITLTMDLTWKSKNIDFMIHKMKNAESKGFNRFEWTKTVISKINERWVKKNAKKYTQQTPAE